MYIIFVDNILQLMTYYHVCLIIVHWISSRNENITIVNELIINNTYMEILLRFLNCIVRFVNIILKC